MSGIGHLRGRAAAASALVLWLLGGAAGGVCAATETHRYRERTGAAVRHYRWSIDAGDTVRIVSTDGERTFTAWCRRDGATLRWERAEAGGRLRVVREGNRLRLEGLHRGRTVDRSEPIDDAPWYQPLSFSLRGVADGGRGGATRFWTLRPDDLSVWSMTAVAVGREAVPVSGARVSAVKVEVRPAGWRSGFWRCHYWFRAADGVLVRYRGVHGLPGTPETVVEWMPDGGDGAQMR